MTVSLVDMMAGLNPPDGAKLCGISDRETRDLTILPCTWNRAYDVSVAAAAYAGFGTCVSYCFSGSTRCREHR